MQLGYTILYVPDVAQSLTFYERAFGLSTKFLHESGGFGELNTGSTSLAFCSHALLRELGKKPHLPDVDHPTSEIALVTHQVKAAFDKAVQMGAKPLQDPAHMPWQQTVAYVADLNGFWVELCTPVGVLDDNVPADKT